MLKICVDPDSHFTASDLGLHCYLELSVTAWSFFCNINIRVFKESVGAEY